MQSFLRDLRQEPILSEENVFYRAGRADQDRYIVQRLPLGYVPLDLKETKEILRKSIASLDHFVCSHESYNDIGSTLAVVNMVEIRTNKKKPPQRFIDGATVGDSRIRLVGEDKLVGEQKSKWDVGLLTPSHNLDNQKFREENFENEDLCIFGRNGDRLGYRGQGHPRLNTTTHLDMGRSMGDYNSKEFYRQLYSTESKKKKTVKDSKEQLLQNNGKESSKTGHTSEPAIKQGILDPNIVVTLASDGLEWLEPASVVNSQGNLERIYFKVNAIRKLVDDNQAPFLTAKQLVTTARDKQLELGAPEEIIDDATAIVATLEGNYTYGVFDGHGGKEVAELCQYFYPSIQTAWTFFSYLPNGSLAEEKFKGFLKKALNKAKEKMPKQLGKNEVLSFESLFFGYLLEIISEQLQGTDLLKNLLIAYNRTILGTLDISASEQFDQIFNFLLEDILIGMTGDQQSKPKWFSEILTAYQGIFPNNLDPDYIEFLNQFFIEKIYAPTKSTVLDPLDKEITRIREDNGCDHIKIRQLKTAKREVTRTLLGTVGTEFKQSKTKEPSNSPTISEKKTTSVPSLQPQALPSINKAVKENVLKELDNLSKNKIICGYRNKVRAFLKGLMGAVMLIFPLTIPVVIWKWNTIFKSDSENKVNDIKKNYSSYNLDEQGSSFTN